MARIFKKTRKRYVYRGKRVSAAKAQQLAAQGRKVTVLRQVSSKWYIRYTGPDGRPREVPGYTDKGATQALAVKLQRQAEREAAGLTTPADAYLTDPPETHLADFQRHLQSKGDSADHVQRTIARIAKTLQSIAARQLADITAARVQAFLLELRARGLSVQTVNHYLTAIKTFTRWLWKQGRLASDPLVGLSRQNADVDRRHLRRVLSPGEFARLVEAAENSPRVFRGLSGPDRAALYMLAAGSGPRASELASVTLATLLLDADPPRVQVQAAYTKNRRDDTVPLPVEVAQHLRRWLARRISRAKWGTLSLDRQQRLWPGTWYRRAADMLKADLAEAGIPYEQDGQVFDFHALRAQYATLLGKQGVNLQTAQALLRHSDPKLTARTYTKLGITDLAGAVEGIRLLGAQEQRQVAS